MTSLRLVAVVVLVMVANVFQLWHLKNPSQVRFLSDLIFYCIDGQLELDSWDFFISLGIGHCTWGPPILL
jgi:hypothetical protein